jgi:hypothetical protein
MHGAAVICDEQMLASRALRKMPWPRAGRV